MNIPSGPFQAEWGYCLCGRQQPPLHQTFSRKVRNGEKMEESIDLFQSDLVPEHVVLNPTEKENLLKKFNISLKQMPRIKKNDPVAVILKAEKGDVIRIKRNDPVIEEYYYYRVVV